MGRSRSRSTERRRGRSSSRERRRARSRSRERDRKQEKRSNRSRDRSREDKYRRRDHDVGSERKERDAAEAGPDSKEAQKKARLEKLAAWKRQREQQQQQQQPVFDAPADNEEDVPASTGNDAKVWMPWEDPDAAYAAQAASAIPVVPQEILAKKAKAAAKLYEEKAAELAAKGAEDPLDAFMAHEILPEVKQKEQQEAARKEEERKKLAQQLAEGKKLPKLTEILESDDEPEPDMVLEVPVKKVKMVVGPGGERIKLIEHKSKARLQILKEEEELNRAFGSGPVLPKPKVPTNGEAEPQMTKIMIFGNANQCEVAQRMIQEAIENKEQKQKQREREYEKKREQKARDRQLYYMRHTRDYETLELPVGASRADVKAAYRKLAKVWHPDKHPDNKEEATERFQKISKAYDSLMLTEEDARIEALAHH